jgi:hypothetical protein
MIVIWLLYVLMHRNLTPHFYLDSIRSISNESELLKFRETRNKVYYSLRTTEQNYFCNEINDSAKSKDIRRSWSLINSLLGKQNRTHINFCAVFRPIRSCINCSLIQLILRRSGSYTHRLVDILSAWCNRTFISYF